MTAGSWYEFRMIAEGDGDIRYEVWDVATGLRMVYWIKHTGGAFFIVTGRTLVGLYWYTGFTNYEEVMDAASGTPNHDFDFR